MFLYEFVFLSYSKFCDCRHEEQLEGTSDQPRENAGSKEVAGEENDLFWGLDDIPGS